MKRVALVGGGGSGIGRSVAGRLAGDGMTVMLTGRRPEVLAAAAAEIAGDLGAGSGRVLWTPGDVTVADDIERVVATTRTEIGEIDVLVLNAGGPPPGTVLAVEESDWYHAIELLLLGPLRLIRAVLPSMAERGFGRVILVTSAIVRQPVPDLSLSVVLRSAATAMAKLVATEHAEDGVTVNCVAPGPIATARRAQILGARAARLGVDVATVDANEARQVPVKRAGRPDEVADAVGYLASEAASYVNGTVLTVDGGLTGLVW